MPKSKKIKSKKTINKNKNKNTINIKIDNSRKTTRRTHPGVAKPQNNPPSIVIHTPAPQQQQPDNTFLQSIMSKFFDNNNFSAERQSPLISPQIVQPQAPSQTQTQAPIQTTEAEQAPAPRPRHPLLSALSQQAPEVAPAQPPLAKMAKTESKTEAPISKPNFMDQLKNAIVNKTLKPVGERAIKGHVPEPTTKNALLEKFEKANAPMTSNDDDNNEWDDSNDKVASMKASNNHEENNKDIIKELLNDSINTVEERHKAESKEEKELIEDKPEPKKESEEERKKRLDTQLKAQREELLLKLDQKKELKNEYLSILEQLRTYKTSTKLKKTNSNRQRANEILQKFDSNKNIKNTQEVAKLIKLLEDNQNVIDKSIDKDEKEIERLPPTTSGNVHQLKPSQESEGKQPQKMGIK